MLGQGEQDEPKTWHLRQYIKLFQTVATAKMETKQHYPKIPLLSGWSWKASVEKVSLSRNLFGDKNPVQQEGKRERSGEAELFIKFRDMRWQELGVLEN